MFPTIMTFAVLMGGMALFLLAREHQRKSRLRRLRAGRGPGAALPAANIGHELAEFISDTHDVRLVLEAALDHDAQVEMLDAQLTQVSDELRRRPLWLRLEDANLAYDLDVARAAACAWLERLEQLAPAHRAELARRGLETAAVVALSEAGESLANDDPRALAALVRVAVDQLHRFEVQLATEGGHGYR